MEPVQTLVRKSANIFQRVSAFAILAGAFVCLVYFLVYFALNSAFTTQAFDALVNADMRGKISWRRLSWGPRPSQLNILEPTLLGAAGQSIIQAKSITIDDLDILGLFKGRLTARGVHIDTPVVRIVSHTRAEDADERGAEGKVLNISEMFWPHGRKVSDGTDGGMEIDLSGISIRNAMFVLDLPTTSIVSHGIQIPDATFRSYSKGNNTFTAVEAELVKIRSSQLRLARNEAMRRPFKGQIDDYRSWSFEKLMLTEFQWLGDQISATKLQTLLEKDPFYLTDIKLNSDRPHSPFLSCRVRLETPKIQRHLAHFVKVPITGEVTLTGNIEGEVETLGYEANILGREMTIFGLEVPRLDAAIRQDDKGRLRLDSLRLGLPEGQVLAQGELTLDRGVGTVDIFPHAVPISSLPVSLSEEGKRVIKGELFGRVSATFSNLFDEIPAYAVNTQLSLQSSRTRPYGLGKDLSLRSFVTVRDDTLKLELVELKSGPVKLNVDGVFDLDTFIMDMRGRTSISEISPLMRSLKYPLRGSVNVRFVASGFLTRPRIQANLKARQIKQASLPAADITGLVVYENGTLDLDRVNIKSETGSIGLKGRIALKKPGRPMDLRINARQFELASLPLQHGVSGRAALDIHLTGKMKKPKISGRGRIGRPCWKTKYGPKPLCFRRIDVNGEWLGDGFRVGFFRIRDNRNTLVDLTGQGSVSARSFTGNLKLKHVPATLINHFVAKPLPVRGSLSAQLELDGHLKAPSGSGKIQIHNGGFKEYEFGQADFEVTADRKIAHISGRFLDAFTLRADIPVNAGQGPGTAVVEFHDLRVEKHLPQLADTPLNSVASGRLEAKFDPFAAKLLDATARLDGLQAKYTVTPDVSYVLELRDTFTLKWNGKTLNTEHFDARFKLHQREDLPDNRKPVESFLMLSGGTTEDGELDIALRGTLDLSLAEPALKSAFTQTAGHVDIAGTLRGPITAPTPNLKLTLQAGEFVPRVSIIGAQLDLAEPVVLVVKPRTDSATQHAGNLQITLAKTRGISKAPNRMLVMRDDSLITADDIQIDFEEYGLDRIRVGISGNELALNIPRVMRGTFDATRLTFESWTEYFDDRRAERRMKVSGEIDVVQGEYMADVTGAAELNQGFRDRLSGRTQTRTVSLFERTPSLKRLMLDLKVSGDGGFYVRNQVLTLTTNLEIRLNLDRIQGFLYPLPGDTPEERLTIDGDIAILPDSTITYARREFEVTNGLVSFGGRDFLDAQIQANRTFTLRTGQGTSTATTSFDTGSSDIRQEEVVLSARLAFPTQESPPSFSFDLSSNSGASKFEVVMLVLTGSYPENLSGAASAQPATEVVLAPLLNLVERPLEDTFKVDLTLTPVSTGTLHIDANKVLSRRLYLYSRVLVGEEQDGNPQQFGLRYQINNVAFGELSNERTGNNISTTGRLKLRVNLN